MEPNPQIQAKYSPVHERSHDPQPIGQLKSGMNIPPSENLGFNRDERRKASTLENR